MVPWLAVTSAGSVGIQVQRKAALNPQARFMAASLVYKGPDDNTYFPQAHIFNHEFRCVEYRLRV